MHRPYKRALHRALIALDRGEFSGCRSMTIDLVALASQTQAHAAGLTPQQPRVVREFLGRIHLCAPCAWVQVLPISARARSLPKVGLRLAEMHRVAERHLVAGLWQSELSSGPKSATQRGPTRRCNSADWCPGKQTSNMDLAGELNL